MTKVAYVEWPDGLSKEGDEWEKITADVKNTDAEILITNEMPFGAWRPTTATYNTDEGIHWQDENEKGIGQLKKLGVRSILSSRPIVIGDKLVNEAFLLQDGNYQTLHQKHYFPCEEGWYEANWFENKLEGFKIHSVGNVKIGVLLCTELMYNEKARQLGQLGADLIITPRASGQNTVNWQAACAMAAVVSGAYVASSNRVGQSNATVPNFGGCGLAYEPGGNQIGRTDAKNPINTFDIDTEFSERAKTEYPCYLKY